MTDPANIVREFCDLMVKRNAELLRPYLAEDAVYQNTGMPATHGIEAILGNLTAQFERFPDSYEYETLNLAADGNTVLTERLDYIAAPGGKPQGVPVMGTFVLRDGKIARWTDYWDTTLPQKMMSSEDVRALLPESY